MTARPGTVSNAVFVSCGGTMADRRGSRKHKWSIPPEISPSKYLRGSDSKFPSGVYRCRDRTSDSSSPPRERQVTLYPYESTQKRSLDLRDGGNSIERAQGRGQQRTSSLDFQRSERQKMSTPSPVMEGDHRLEMNDDSKTKSEGLHRARGRRLHAPSLLFKRAFSDILGGSPRQRRSLDSQTTSQPEAERITCLQRQDFKDSEPSPRKDNPEKESADHTSWLRRTITKEVAKEEPEVCKEEEEAPKQKSKPLPRMDTPGKESADHPSWLRGTTTRSVSIEKSQVCKEKPEACKKEVMVHKQKSEPSSKTYTTVKEIAEEKSSWISGSPHHPNYLRQTITRAAPKEEMEVRNKKPKDHKEKSEARKDEKEDHKERPRAPEDTSRLVFIDDSDNDSDTGDHLDKDPSIGSDFSDIEDMGTLARFSQEDSPLPGCSAESTTAGTSTPSYVMHPPHLYGSSWNKYTDLWPTSPLYKPSVEQNTWRQGVLNQSCVSDVYVNAELSKNTSSESEDEVDKRPERSSSPFTQRTCDDKTKTEQRTLDISSAMDYNTPKFLREGFIDTHCHLDMLFARLQHKHSFADLRKQYASTFPSEFQGCITDYCDPRTLERLPWRNVLNENLVWGAFGCHPHFAQYYTSELQEEMMQAMRHPKAIAYGEMGLDYSHKCSTTMSDQHAVFEKQLKLAVQLGKPLVIHCRDADDDLLKIMKKWVPRDYKIHRHCFTGNYKDIEPLLNEFPNLMVGFTAVLTYSSAASARQAVTRIPIDRLIIETDAPFFVPRQVPKSLCKFSHPGLALHTVEEVARLKNLSLKSVMTKVRDNTHWLYNI
ncbi:putative deoxyribonuclease TATDN2 isoform X2 [Pyxicephalus adspersus]|uniref:putative deoxyribonuclease TATDN2 isoform X2 n=1 Tax=Pyxicephalus adspersus TaxID=30357 RepID=UPI003B5AEBE2